MKILFISNYSFSQSSNLMIPHVPLASPTISNSHICPPTPFQIPPMDCLPGPTPLKATGDKFVKLKDSCRGIFVKSNSFYSCATTARGTQLTYCASTGGAFSERSVRMASFSVDATDDRILRIASTIRVIPDFPKPGILFQDITTLLLDPKAFKDTIDLFVERYKGKNINVIAGVEARGFIFGPPIALAIGAKFVPMRKPKKLPGEVISEEYFLEYGTDKIEMHVGAVQPGDRAVVVDDLIATGGTLNAAVRLLERVGAHVVECACVIELPELKGREKLGDKSLFVLVS